MDVPSGVPPWNTVIFQKNTKKTLSFFGTELGEWEHDMGENGVRLQGLRKQIEKYEKNGSGSWEYYKKIVNPYEFVYTQKKYDTFPESVCLLRPLSRSYFKMIEILKVSQFFERRGQHPQDERLRTAHVCEGPGGFIEGIYDECAKRRFQPTSTLAMTLRPKEANIPGWKRATHFLNRHPGIKVIYGKDGTGDLLVYENQNEYIKQCSPRVHIFTADGGFDFSVDYISQERSIFRLLVTSVRIGFECLREGGMFILKVFDFYHAATIDLLFFLSQHFKKWTLYKPATSRPCNPEQYFIGVDFMGCRENVLLQLREWSMCVCNGGRIRRLFHPEIRASVPEFQTIIANMSATIEQSQIAALTRIFQIIESGRCKDMATNDLSTILKGHEWISYEWCKVFNAPVYPNRIRALEVSHSGPQVVFPQSSMPGVY